MPTVRARRFVSLDEYFVIEQMSDARHEYDRGDVLAMAGGSPRHNQVAANLLVLLAGALRGAGCRVFGSDQRVATADELYTYPDLVVFCGPISLVGGRPSTATNPVVLVEVLSDSTRDYDRGQKLDRYRTIPSLREVLLVDPDPELGIERWTRTDQGWARMDVTDTITLSCGGAPFPVADIYDGVADLPE